jgi:hypothetical protein
LAKNAVFYKGRRKKRNYAIIPTVIILALISLTLVLFYGMQKYAVITKDGVNVELPILKTEKTTVDSQGHEVRVFDRVDTEIVYDPPDYSYIKATAGKDTPELRAIFVPAENLNREKLQEYSARLKAGNALVLEMKPRSGILMWESQSPVAMNYGLSTPNEQTAEMPTLISELKEDDVYLVAQISCCIDELFASRSTNVTLRRADNGGNYMDESGTWLDPYNLTVRSYVIDMVRELYALGFDEVVLADIAHPTFSEPVELVYTRELSQSPSTVTAVCGFAINVARELHDREGKLSIYCDSKPALVKADDNGQDARLFMKLYDRVFLRTDKYAYPYNVEDIKGNIEIGSVHNRLVPVVENYLPENSSWVLVDVAEEPEEDD